MVRFFKDLMPRITHVMEWRDADKCILASTLTLGFVGVWILRMWLVERNPAYGPYMNPDFVEPMMALVLFQAFGHLSIVATAALLRRKARSMPGLVHVTNQFWYLCFFTDVYAVGAFTSPFIMLFLLAAVFGFIVFPLRPVVLSLGTFSALLVTSTIAERLGFIPYAPLISTNPLNAGRPHTSFILSLGLLPLLASALVLGLFAYVVTQLRDREKRLKEMVKTDYLTGVENRRSFMHRTEIEFARARRFKKPLAVVMLDVDHFKRVNDSYGHGTGDEVLKVVARILAAEVRRHDVIARYGGEEFALLLAETDETQARIMAERCRQKIESARLAMGGAAIKVTASVGIAAYPREDVSRIEQLIELADKALYQAKEAGRNRTVSAA
ncbi:MAG: GGDEF domain-containing protein [Deltaproteobacteria bacterium]|nr:GGDEF domain-containing protein [Deltaproteobacteria bacterium]